jgi:branched-subunit amino acid transport protein
MSYSTLEIWLIIWALAIGTFLIRLSFLALVGARGLPPLVLRLLRYTPVAVIPGMVAPLVLWPAATGGQTDLPRLAASVAVLAVGLRSRNALAAMGAGALVLYAGLGLTALI